VTRAVIPWQDEQDPSASIARWFAERFVERFVSSLPDRLVPLIGYDSSRPVRGRTPCAVFFGPASGGARSRGDPP
jgi:hypothetical protein